MDIVFDATTLILVAKIELLREIAENVRVNIPEKVKEECLHKKTIDSVLIETLIRENKIAVKKAGNGAVIKKLQSDFRLGAGEAEALRLAQSLNCLLAVDDGSTIKACKIMGQQFKTAIHFLLELSEQNKIQKSIAGEKLKKLAFYGRYHHRIIEDASRRLKGEKP